MIKIRRQFYWGICALGCHLNKNEAFVVVVVVVVIRKKNVGIG